MKWPFVRRSKYNHLMKCLDIKNGAIVDQMENIKTQFNENNRLNQELANELNSHRETKEMWQESLAHNDLFLNKIKDLEKELEEINQLRFDKSHLKQKENCNKKVKPVQQSLFFLSSPILSIHLSYFKIIFLIFSSYL